MARRQSNVQELLGKASELISKQRLGEAGKLCKKALALKPDNPDAHMLLAGVLEQSGDKAAAIGEYRKAIEADPRHLASLVNLGVCQKEMGNLPSAIDAFDHAVAVDPNNVVARYNLARALYDAGLLDLAIEQFEAVLKLRPGWAEVENNIGEACIQLARFDKALEWYRTSLQHKGDMAVGYIGLGWAYQAKGDFDASKKALREALRLNPLVGRAYRILTLMPQTPEEAAHDLQAIRKALDGTAVLSKSQKVSHNLAAYRILNARNETHEAFRHLSDAHKLNSELHPPDQDLPLTRKMVQDARDVLTADFLASNLGNGNPSTVPVFIMGMPRSGTTLTEQIIASHPEATGAGELPTVSEIKSSMARLLDRPIEFPRDAAALSGKDLDILSRHYLNAYPPETAGALRVVDKSLPNVFHVGLIKFMFPNAKIVFCQRDAMDVCWSCYSAGFGAGMVRYASDFDCLAEMYRLNMSMMEHWRSVLPDDTMVLRYETLLSDFEIESKRLIDFIGLDWDDACLAFHETERDIATSSVWQVRQPLYQTSIGKWRPYEEYLAPLREALGEYADA